MTISGNFEQFYTLTLKQMLSKTKNLKLEYRFLVESNKIENVSFPLKLPYQKPMLRQIESRVQNGPNIKNGVLSVTTFFF